MPDEHTTPLASEIHTLLTLSLQNSKALKGTHEQRARIIMDDLADAGLRITTMAEPRPETAADAADEPATVPPHSIDLPFEIGRDHEAREGTTRVLVVADIDNTQEPNLVALDFHENSDISLGWFDVDTMVRQLAEFAPDLVVMRREDFPEVTITQRHDEPTTCTVTVNGVVRFVGRDLNDPDLAHEPVVPKAAYDDAAAEITRLTGDIEDLQATLQRTKEAVGYGQDEITRLRNQLTDARMKLATAEGTIEHLRGRIQTLTDACQRKNGDCARYAEEQQTAIEARKAAENEAGDLRARWAAYATALARLENITTPQVIGKNVVMRHETYTKMESERDQLAESWVTFDAYESTVNRMTAETQRLRLSRADVIGERNAARDQLDQERRGHEETRRELRDMTAHARKWQRFAAVIELMEDAGDAELTIDGVQIRVVKS